MQSRETRMALKPLEGSKRYSVQSPFIKMRDHNVGFYEWIEGKQYDRHQR